jgi:hypothetical protein
MSNLDRRDSGDVAGGGGGGGVTPAELQAAIATRVAKAGDTMTGALTAPKFVGTGKIERATSGSRRQSASYSLLDTWQMNNATNAGLLIIRMPVITVNTMCSFKIALGTNADSKSSGTIEIGGYWLYTNPASVATRPTVRSFNFNLVNRIRLALDTEGRHSIVLNTPGNTWAYPRVTIYFAEQGWYTTNDLSTGWEYQILGTLPEYTSIIEPELNAGLVPASGYSPAARGYLNGSTGAFTLKYGDMAVTKTGTGAYQIASGSLAGFKAELAIESAIPILPATFDAATSTLRTWDLSGNPADASGNIFVWI